MGLHDGLIYLKVGRASTQALNINTPLRGIKSESLKGSCLAEELNGIDMLVSAVVPCTWVAFGVLVGHGRTECIEDGARSDVFGGNEENGLLLTLDLFFLGTL